MDLFTILMALFVWATLFVAIKAFKESSRIHRVYRMDTKASKEINQFKLTGTFIDSVAKLVSNVIGDDNTIKLGPFYKLYAKINRLGVSRVSIEQTTLLSLIIDQEKIEQTPDFKVRYEQIVTYFSELNFQIRAWEKHHDIKFTPIETMYIQRYVTRHMARKYGRGSLEEFFLIKGYKKIFNKEPINYKRVTPETLVLITRVFSKQHIFQSKARGEYMTSMALKTIFFLHPNIENAKSMARFKSAIN